MLPFPVGVHLLFKVDHEPLPSSLREALRESVTQSASLCSCRLRECAILEDHMHVLLEIRDEDEAAPVIHAIHDATTAAAQEQLQGFSWDDQVHVTLMPPWHVELFASFLRDQDRYHAVHTVQEELDQILSPDAMQTQRKKADRSRGVVGLHSSGVS